VHLVVRVKVPRRGAHTFGASAQCVLTPLLYAGETEEENMTNGHLTFFDAP
jgi:hypothetical protein